MELSSYYDVDKFDVTLNDFLRVFGHEGVCFDEENVAYRYATKISQRIQEKKSKDNGYIFHEEPQWFKDYCDTTIYYLRKFEVVFGVWYGLPEKECLFLAERHPPLYSKLALNAFLCGKSYDEVYQIFYMKETTYRKKEMLYVDYEGEAILFYDGKEIPAVKGSEYLIISQNDKHFTVGYD